MLGGWLGRLLFVPAPGGRDIPRLSGQMCSLACSFVFYDIPGEYLLVRDAMKPQLRFYSTDGLDVGSNEAASEEEEDDE